MMNANTRRNDPMAIVALIFLILAAASFAGSIAYAVKCLLGNPATISKSLRGEGNGKAAYPLK